MEEIIFTFPSFTYANKARRLLQRAELTASPIKLGPIESGNGCAHGLSIPHRDYYSAVRLLLENRIEYGVYRR